MALAANIVGFSLFGLAVRMYHLGIQKRNLLDSFTGHAFSMGAWGFAGYWAYQWEGRAAELLAAKRAEIRAKRERIAAVEES